MHALHRRRARRLTTALGTWTLAVAGCLSPAPPARWTGADVTARAATEDAARRLGTEAEAHLAWIRARVPELRAARPEVWLVPRIEPFRGFPLNEHTSGLTFRFLWIDRIYVLEEAGPGTVAHELGHFLLGSAWAPLPPFLEEGLCDWLLLASPAGGSPERRAYLEGIAALGFGGKVLLDQAGPDGGREELASLSFHSDLPTLEQAARYGSHRMLSGAPEDRFVGFGYGLFLFERGLERFGWEGWLDLCRGSRERGETLDLERVLSRLGYADLDEVARDQARSMGGPALELVVSEVLDEPLLQRICSVLGAGVAPRDPRLVELLRDRDVTCRVPDGAAAIGLAEVVADWQAEQAKAAAEAGAPVSAPGTPPARPRP